MSANDPELPSSLTRELTKFRQLTVQFRSCVCAWLKRRGIFARLQACQETAKCGALVHGLPSDEERIYIQIRATERVHPNCSAMLAAIRDGAGQKRHAHVGGYASNDTVERAELKTGCRRPSELA